MILQHPLHSAQPPAVADLQSLSRGLKVLTVLMDAEKALTLTELSVAVGLHKTTVLRLLRTLSHSGYVSADPLGPRYLPGPVLLRNSVIRSSTSLVVEAAAPVMTQMAVASQETVALFLPAWPDLICASVVPSPQLIRRHREVGEIQPMTRAAVGRAFLSHASESYVKATLAARPLRPLTSQTVINETTFLALLKSARRCGYAISAEETNADMAGLAAPIPSQPGDPPVGVLSVSGPLYRWAPAQLDHFGPTLVEASHHLGDTLARFRPTRERFTEGHRK